MWFMLISGWVNTPFPFINAMYVFSFKDVTSFCSESDCFLSRPLVNVSLVNTEGSSPAWGYVFSEFVRRPLRQSCVVKYQFELIHSPKRSSKFQFFWTWLYYPEGILSLSLASQSKAWACYMITADSLSYYNVTWKSLWETGNSMHRGWEKQWLSSERMHEAVRLWISSCSLRYPAVPHVSFALRYYHSMLDMVFPSGQDVPLQK